MLMEAEGGLGAEAGGDGEGTGDFGFGFGTLGVVDLGIFDLIRVAGVGSSSMEGGGVSDGFRDDSLFDDFCFPSF